MLTVNMFTAKSTLSQLVVALETGKESEVIIARNGKPAAKLIPINQPSKKTKRIGVAAGKFKVPESIDEQNEEVLKLFLGEG
ncbi:MAG: type II toxin-antitoxin system Phd/YefM family antitoxin [Burkholderiaceae bacterium]|nr:type II toxin-antitoxin system Phd/YefM family antitoxin [Burkholderiaceae bacterium]MCD8536586.1 type II toxin-antitoxin system Phd/YefM family antitoxin [Burkholderiaceae bacterium]MCD8566252.1 type II toxin-antitoxin system Phd/YefM family antitoxin [Burkholderiaceae bacterium]